MSEQEQQIEEMTPDKLKTQNIQNTKLVEQNEHEPIIQIDNFSNKGYLKDEYCQQQNENGNITQQKLLQNNQQYYCLAKGNFNYLQAQSEKEQEDIVFHQLLGKMLFEYETAENAFNAIDSEGKGIIQQEDLIRELQQKFEIYDHKHQISIFQKLSLGKDEVKRDDFVQIMKQQDRRSQNLLNHQDDHQIEQQIKRSEIINIFDSNKKLEPPQESHQTLFGENNKYVSVITKLRQQPNFNDFVLSYNSLQFPKFNGNSKLPKVSLGQQEYNPFSQMSSSPNVNDNHFGLLTQSLSLSGSKRNFKDFSPKRISNSSASPQQRSAEQQTNQREKIKQYKIPCNFKYQQLRDKYSETQPSNNTELQKSMKRRVNEISKFTFGTKSEVFCPSTNVIQETHNQKREIHLKQRTSSFYTEEEKGKSLINLFNSDLPSSQLTKNNYFSTLRSNSKSFSNLEDQKQKLTPYESKLNTLKRKIGLGVNSSTQGLRNTEHLQSLNRMSLGLFPRNSQKNSFSQSGQLSSLQSSTKSVKTTGNLQQEDKLGEVLEKIQKKRISNIQLEKIKKIVPDLITLGTPHKNRDPSINGPFRPSSSPKGINGQMQRVQHIKEQIRAASQKRLEAIRKSQESKRDEDKKLK